MKRLKNTRVKNKSINSSDSIISKQDLLSDSMLHIGVVGIFAVIGVVVMSIYAFNISVLTDDDISG